MRVFVGDDWAETQHGVHLMNDLGERLAAKRFSEGLQGIAGGRHAVPIAPAPARLTVATEARPLNADTLDLLAELTDAGAAGLRLANDRRRLALDLHGRHLTRPIAHPGGVAVALSWHTAEAHCMAAAVPGALDDWAPNWWPAGAPDDLAARVVHALDADLARWVAASVAGLELHDRQRW